MMLNRDGQPITDDPRFWRGCIGKISYSSKKHARAGARLLAKLFPDDPRKDQIDAYGCKMCRKWHVGHNHKKRSA